MAGLRPVLLSGGMLFGGAAILGGLLLAILQSGAGIGGLALMGSGVLLLISMAALDHLYKERPQLRGEAEAICVPSLLARLGPSRLPSRRVVHDALIWLDGRAHLVIPLTGPYERARADYLESLISLTHLMTEEGLATPTDPLEGGAGRREALRRMEGSSASWPFRKRHLFFRLGDGVITELLSELP